MLTYRMKEKNQTSIIYFYYPEGNENNPGEVAFYDDGSRKVLKKAKDDSGSYSGHALAGINKKFTHGTVAWF